VSMLVSVATIEKDTDHHGMVPLEVK
jgi:hypothetical protein